MWKIIRLIWWWLSYNDADKADKVDNGDSNNDCDDDVDDDDDDLKDTQWEGNSRFSYFPTGNFTTGGDGDDDDDDDDDEDFNDDDDDDNDDDDDDILVYSPGKAAHPSLQSPPARWPSFFGQE